jgi:integrase
VTLYRPKKSPYWHYDFQWKGVRYHGSTGFTGRRDAERVEAEAKHDARLPQRTRPAISLDDAAGLYADRAQALTSWPTTRYILASLIASLGKATPLSAISQKMLLDHVARRRGGAKAKGGKPRSNATINREIEVARALWRYAVAARYDVGEMPDWGKLMLRVPRQRWAILDDGEDAQLLDGCREDVRPALAFLMASGWRRNEVIGLRWADCHLNQAMAWTRIKGGDTVPRALSPALVALIANQPRVGPFVFTYVCQRASGGRNARVGRRHGERYPLTATVLRSAWQDARTACGLDHVRIHDLRHTRLTRIYEATRDFAATRDAGAHRSQATTERYVHITLNRVRDAISASESRNIPEPASPQIRKKH